MAPAEAEPAVPVWAVTATSTELEKLGHLTEWHETDEASVATVKDKSGKIVWSKAYDRKFTATASLIVKSTTEIPVAGDTVTVTANGKANTWRIVRTEMIQVSEDVQKLSLSLERYQNETLTASAGA